MFSGGNDEDGQQDGEMEDLTPLPNQSNLTGFPNQQYSQSNTTQRTENTTRTNVHPVFQKTRQSNEESDQIQLTTHLNDSLNVIPIFKPKGNSGLTQFNQRNFETLCNVYKHRNIQKLSYHC
jgi:hypothetical protein